MATGHFRRLPILSHDSSVSMFDQQILVFTNLPSVAVSHPNEVNSSLEAMPYQPKNRSCLTFPHVLRGSGHTEVNALRNKEHVRGSGSSLRLQGLAFTILNICFSRPAYNHGKCTTRRPGTVVFSFDQQGFLYTLVQPTNYDVVSDCYSCRVASC